MGYCYSFFMPQDAFKCLLHINNLKHNQFSSKLYRQLHASGVQCLEGEWVYKLSLNVEKLLPLCLPEIIFSRWFLSMRLYSSMLYATHWALFIVWENVILVNCYFDFICSHLSWKIPISLTWTFFFFWSIVFAIILFLVLHMFFPFLDIFGFHSKSMS